jgi:hypothetical protein
MRAPQIIDSNGLIELLKKDNGHILSGSYIVQGNTQIDGKEIVLESFCLDNVAFNGQLKLSNQPKLKSVSLRSCNFLRDDGLNFEYCKGGYFSLHDMKAHWIDFYMCSFETLCLQEVQVGRSLDLSGLTLKKRLTLEKVFCDNIELHSDSGDHHIEVPLVRTDDSVMVRQFELARIPVFTSTAAVREQIERQLTSLARAG